MGEGGGPGEAVLNHSVHTLQSEEKGDVKRENSISQWQESTRQGLTFVFVPTLTTELLKSVLHDSGSPDYGLVINDMSRGPLWGVWGEDDIVHFSEILFRVLIIHSLGLWLLSEAYAEKEGVSEEASSVVVGNIETTPNSFIIFNTLI